MTVKGRVKFFNETKGCPAANVVLGTTYGNPGGGNFTMPDLRGRFFYNLDTSTGRLSLIGGTALGATAGSQSQTISQSQLPNVSLSAASLTATFTGTQSNYNIIASGGDAAQVADISHSPGAGFQTSPSGTFAASGFAQGTPVGTVAIGGSVPLGGSGVAVPTIPPAMGINCMMRIA